MHSITENLQLTLLEAEEDSCAAAFFAMALLIDLRIMLSLLLAREYFSAKEVLWLLWVPPTQLRRPERRVLDVTTVILLLESWRSTFSRLWEDRSPWGMAGCLFLVALGVDVLAFRSMVSSSSTAVWSWGTALTAGTSCSSLIAPSRDACSAGTASQSASPQSALSCCGGNSAWGQSLQSTSTMELCASAGNFSGSAGSSISVLVSDLTWQLGFWGCSLLQRLWELGLEDASLTLLLLLDNLK